MRQRRPCLSVAQQWCSRFCIRRTARRAWWHDQLQICHGGWHRIYGGTGGDRAPGAAGHSLPTGRLRSHWLFVSESLADQKLVDRTPKRHTAAAIYAGRPDIGLVQLGGELKRLHHKPPRGGMGRAVRKGVIGADKGAGVDQYFIVTPWE